mmetsp:Transcript_46941/g.150873  ORF Transcript_46941/g.150873 Transcript_46941/m.150873 type:complete len:212 (-) Transcript_46941:79-714(-)|eukprot:CAMPEP_0203904580 /NCGR_PEP_ID=MMETSP0359-20131031/46390_1 /ASSEMBLY_ACC=CAM_ASM_000338 /TAXON_ID=268821 /ORGANISM="Scrippsiella Hangoei, Strain SHTV-5" /LENGTH=211 /DNA_ID=CAMNT_0050828855 /DNA_START=53 /DNA_END=688 /DNA_ORIENTATION=-
MPVFGSGGHSGVFMHKSHISCLPSYSPSRSPRGGAGASNLDPPWHSPRAVANNAAVTEKAAASQRVRSIVRGALDGTVGGDFPKPSAGMPSNRVDLGFSRLGHGLGGQPAPTVDARSLDPPGAAVLAVQLDTSLRRSIGGPASPWYRSNVFELTPGRPVPTDFCTVRGGAAPTPPSVRGAAPAAPGAQPRILSARAGSMEVARAVAPGVEA